MNNDLSMGGAGSSTDLQLELLRRLQSMERELGQLRGLLALTAGVPEISSISPSAAGAAIGFNRRKIDKMEEEDLQAPARVEDEGEKSEDGEGEDAGVMMVTSSDAVRRQKKKAKREQQQCGGRPALEDGLALLPPEIWTHIMGFLARCGSSRRPAGDVPPSPQRATDGDVDHAEDEVDDVVDIDDADADGDADAGGGGVAGNAGDGDYAFGEDEELDDEDDQQAVGHKRLRRANRGSPDDGAESGMVLANSNTFSGPLGTATLVCRMWRKIGLAQVTQHRMDSRKHKQHLRLGLPFLAANCANLRVLNLSMCRVVDSMLHHLPAGLTHLDLSSTQITDACIEYLPLSIRYLYLSNTNITNAGVDDVPPHIEALALDYTLISVDKEAAVLEQFTSLRTLSLSASEGVTDKGVSVLPVHLEKLSLSSSGTLDDYHQFGDDAFYRFSTRYPHLACLRLDDVDVSGEGMRELHQCIGLKQLQLAYCSYITDNDLSLLPPNLLSLELHHLRHVEGDGLKHLPTSLEFLCLQRMQHLSVETIAGSLPKKLKVLVLEAAPSGWIDALRKLVQIPVHIVLSAGGSEPPRW